MPKKRIKIGSKIERLEDKNLLSFVMPPAYVDPAPAPTPFVMPPAPVEVAPVEVAFNPDITKFPAPIRSDPNPMSTLFQLGSGQATIVDPAKVPATPPLAPPQTTLPPLPPPLPTTLPSLPRAPSFP